ncbi:MAG TPA: hypothetical protein VFJ14_14870 [Nocardioidaceae bacterium]|nr:hypothetical protein [Nocardioidaceae bacterium]
MTTLILLIGIAVTALGIWLLNRLIDGDGLGHREPPPSHHDDLSPSSPHRWVHGTR